MKLRRFLFPALSIFLGVAAQSAPAAETCYDYCTDGCPAGDGRSECTENCASRCSPGGDLDETHPWYTGPLYGASAYDADNVAYGWSYGKTDERDAKLLALSGCHEHGTSCKIVVQFSDSCAAVAANEKKRFKTGQGASRDEAQAKAMAACGGDCEIKVWSCSQR